MGCNRRGAERRVHGGRPRVGPPSRAHAAEQRLLARQLADDGSGQRAQPSAAIAGAAEGEGSPSASQTGSRTVRKLELASLNKRHPLDHDFQSSWSI